LVPLTTWFEPLAPTAQAQGGILMHAAAVAPNLLATQREIVPLHADLHHENILDFGERGWLAIDPKRVFGERTFEYTILFCDPDLGLPHLTIARRPEIFARRIEVVSKAAGLEARRLLLWILAWAGLSAAWQIDDNLDPGIELRVAEMAWAALNTWPQGGSPRFTRIFKLHQLAADPAQRVIKGRFPFPVSFRSWSPPLPDEPALHEPCGLNHQIG
jgi:streptomycin 6-kinase